MLMEDGLSDREFEEVLFGKEMMLFGETKPGGHHVLNHPVARNQVLFGESEIAGPFVVIEIDDHTQSDRLV